MSELSLKFKYTYIATESTVHLCTDTKHAEQRHGDSMLCKTIFHYIDLLQFIVEMKYAEIEINGR